MTNIVGRNGAWATSFAIVVLALGCGGRTNSEPDTAAGGSTSNPGTPPPTCTEICSHVIGSCVPGAAIDACSRDCEETRTKYMTCKELDPYLRCMPSAAVECAEDKVTIVGCNAERIALESCR